MKQKHFLYITLQFLLIIISGFSNQVRTLSKNEWRARSIYQVLTDRIIIGREPTCHNLKEYCGGTYKDLIALLPHVKDLGFSALYISPIVENIDQGYHGYWTKNFYTLNPNFGTEQELRQLIRQAHQMDILVMVDVVFNHVGYVPEGNIFSGITPFNDPKYYHDWCEIQDQDYHNGGNQERLERCRLSGLPDLKTESEEVKQLLYKWIKVDIIEKYGFDGIRIDTVRHVDKRFWQELNVVLKSIDTFAIGEVTSESISIQSQYQSQMHFDSMLDYPLYYTLQNVFYKRTAPLSVLKDQYIAHQTTFTDASALGLFSDNHDQPRMFNQLLKWQGEKEDIPLALNTLTFIFMSYGIPVLYYGTESMLNGGGDPLNREPYDPSNGQPKFNSNPLDKTMSNYIRALNKVRSDYQTYDFEPDFRLIENSQGVMVFTKSDNVMVVITNTPEHMYQAFYLTNHPFKENDKLCNAFSEWDCVVVDKEKRVKITIVEGHPKLYVKRNDQLPNEEQLQNRFGIFQNILTILFFIILANIFYFSGLLEAIGLNIHGHDTIPKNNNHFKHE
eukprot:403354868